MSATGENTQKVVRPDEPDPEGRRDDTAGDVYVGPDGERFGSGPDDTGDRGRGGDARDPDGTGGCTAHCL